MIEMRRLDQASTLLNPAFCGLMVRDVVRGYERELGMGMPYELAFLALTSVLHEETRAALPRSIATKLHPWLQTHGHLRVGIGARLEALQPFVREAILYATASKLLKLDTDGLLSNSSTVAKSWADAEDTKQLSRASEFVGRWFARAGTPKFIFAMWGLEP